MNGEEKIWIDCRKCGDTVEVPGGRVWCYQCSEESAPRPLHISEE